ncbi:MAG TPA: ImmA/IrrE family metallo-endopeptidase [Pyrinomonadaceae bacterium]|nr:ImmA/IrrE family metallo-endopeptidase [Pyrinomonadaceae bacterium]
MKLLLTKIRKLDCGWNERALDENDFFRLCSKHSITVIETAQQTSGFYFSVSGKHFISVSGALRGPRRLFVMFHEFAHFFLHAPYAAAHFKGVGTKTRQEIEADLFAACAILPQRMIAENSAQALVEELGFPEDLIADRITLFSSYGI